MSSKIKRADHKVTTAVVVYGTDDAGKPRAALFKPSEAKVATKAAKLMNLGVLKVRTPAQAESAAKLPTGRLYANGKGFVPYVRRDLFSQMMALAGGSVRARTMATTAAQPAKVGPAGTEAAADPQAGSPTPLPSDLSRVLPRTWADIQVGSLVLAHDGVEEGWWEAIVIKREGDTLTLRARDYPKVPPFKLHSTAVALINPGPV